MIRPAVREHRRGGGERWKAGERRRHPRYALALRGTASVIELPARWSRTREAFEILSADVSLGGMKVHFADRVRVGDRVRLAFAAPGGGRVVHDAVVRWTRRGLGNPLGEITAGLAFRNDLDEAEIETLLQSGRRGGPVRAAARQVNLPFGRAVEIAVRSLRIRFWRSAVTSAVVLLAIAFLAYMLSIEPVTRAIEIGEAVQERGRAQRLWVALVSMLVAVVGIANTLHMSVAERYREIGTMKCLGALDRFVVELFLLESLAMGFIGSVAGSALGTAAATIPWLLRPKEAAAAVLPWGTLGTNLAIGVGVGLLLTMLGALYPALRAARMAPAEAMRTEV
jgi:putative ABC transport system permease protein